MFPESKPYKQSILCVLLTASHQRRKNVAKRCSVVSVESQVWDCSFWHANPNQPLPYP